MSKKLDYVGHVYGQLTVLWEVGGGAWMCECHCPARTRRVFRIGNLVNGNTTSCGCKKLRHGMANSPEYKIWQQMIRRCHNKFHESYPRYGGVGIEVCAEWRNSFLAFFNEIGKRPSKNYTLDRVDSSKGYQPGNVRWASPDQQNYNKKNTIRVCYQGQTYTTKEFADLFPKERRRCLMARLRHGWSVEQAIAGRRV